ncbi:aldo/keto reductase [Rhodoluna sp.]|uniref:aldo/keto reductase n=1 Tax=Rhodoluna sp. TaxID=1969481 RepID=UPI0025DDAADA|nr:aldo/keto reductase [Rhodoluna sp.]
MTFSPEQMPLLTLNNGQQIPQLGLGVYKVTQDIAVDLIKNAVDAGYRRIDTAALYGNEAEVGQAVRESGLAREELFVTTKIWNDRQGYDEALVAIDESLDRLNIDYVDMLLIHWPCPTQNLFVETWAAFQEAQKGGKIRGIGVSNFQPAHLQKLIAAGGTVPALNQVEMHPGLQQREVREFDSKHAIATEAWSPLARGKFADNEALQSLAAAHNKSVTQIIVRWHIQLGNLVIPKTTSSTRLAENIDVFDFALTEEQMATIAGLDSGMRTGMNPDEFG